MFSAKCANSDCAMPFDYRRGHLFRFTEVAECTLPTIVRHFWLCDACSRAYTLRYANGVAILTRLERQPESEVTTMSTVDN